MSFQRFSILILAIFVLSGCAKGPYQKVRIKNASIYAEIVDTREKRALGLMFRKELAFNKGMLFVFEKEGIKGFWMKNMLIPLDIMWIDSSKKIVDIQANAQPCSKDCPDIIPAANARYVLELNAGFVKRNKIKIGDRVYF